MSNIKLYIKDETVDKVLDYLADAAMDNAEGVELKNTSNDTGKCRQISYVCTPEIEITIQLFVNNNSHDILNIMMIQTEFSEDGPNRSILMDKDFKTLQSGHMTSPASQFIGECRAMIATIER